MDASELDALVQRLVDNPHDEEALAYAHQAGAEDPQAYAFLLEKVGTNTPDPAYASHWLSEAANVWASTLGDAHRAARVLMMAIDKDPTQRVAADRLAELYREKGDAKALAALLDRRARALAPLAANDPEIRNELAGMHEELGRLWNESLGQPRKSLDHFKRAIELDSSSAYAVYCAREVAKAGGFWDEVWPLYEAEVAIEQDPARKVALFRDEANARRAAGDLAGATRSLARARQVDEHDTELQHEYASSILERVHAGQPPAANEKALAAELLVGLAEVYDGEHGLAYASGALDIEAGHDRALQLYAYHARTLGREEDLSARYLAYVDANPDGAMAPDARRALAASYEAAGQYANAIQMLEPLRAVGDTEAAAKVRELYPLAGSQQPNVALVSADAPRRSNAPMSPDKVQGVLDAAQMLAGKGKKPEAFAKYKEVLEVDPSHPEALAWVEDYLRTKRDYSQLRDVLLASVRAVSQSPDALEARKERLREIAGLCEGNLRDVDGAISAWKQLLAIDRADESARQSLTRLLDKTQRWDELANLLEQEATTESDIERKIALEKKLATLHEQKRRDHAAAAEAWSRIARLAPDDDRAILTASKFFEKAGSPEMAAQVIADNVAGLDDPVARSALLERLGGMREQLNDPGAAGEAYAEAADAQQNVRLWDQAERCFTEAERWVEAANAATQRAALLGDAKQEAQLYARAADLLNRAGDDGGVLERLERASDLDPTRDEYANQLVDRYTSAERWDDLVQFLARRGSRLTDRTKRVALRREAATLCATRLGDKEAAREQWLRVLEDGDDREALEKLIDDAIEREDHTEATTLLRRLQHVAVDNADKARVALREAELLAEGVGDIDMAIARYEAILANLDPTCRPALQAIADLQEARDNPGDAADALERELKLVADVQERGQIAARLARLYEQLDNPHAAIRALDIVRKADLEDFDALARLCDLCEKTEQWDRVAELLAQRIEVEADEEEASAMTRKLAHILANKLDRGDEALAALTELADQGDASLREAYIELGDKLGWKGIVAQKLVEWWIDARNTPERTANLRGAFERFGEIGRDQDAVRVGVEIIRVKGADQALAERLESLAVKTGDHDALMTAHDLLARELTGADRAREYVRQAEVRVNAGVPRAEAIQHGEAGLASVPPQDAEPLLERLAKLAEKPNEVIDLYERQVTRCRTPIDKVRGLARAAQVASSRAQHARAAGFFELAFTGAPNDDVLAILEAAAREGDAATGGEKLRRALCSAMANGGQGARDGGRTRASLLRRAASMAYRDLTDAEQAFAWLGDALIAHVDALTLDTLEGLGIEVGDPSRAEAAISRALAEVFDGPLVRQLLSRRARIRSEQMVDKVGAAADLKKLHDLSPNDHAVMEQLSALLTELGDFRGMVQLYEDQILRGKDMNARAELARKVARMWEEQLQDPREAADAWRRVLRMRAGDAEATAGLERAKSNMLKKPDPGASDAYAPPRIDPPPAAAPEKPLVREEPKPVPAPRAASFSVLEPKPEPADADLPPLADLLSLDDDDDDDAVERRDPATSPELVAAEPLPRTRWGAAREGGFTESSPSPPSEPTPVAHITTEALFAATAANPSLGAEESGLTRPVDLEELAGRTNGGAHGVKVGAASGLLHEAGALGPRMTRGDAYGLDATDPQNPFGIEPMTDLSSTGSHSDAHADAESFLSSTRVAPNPEAALDALTDDVDDGEALVTGDVEVYDYMDATMARPGGSHGHARGDEDEIIVADDLAEMIDVEDEAGPEALDTRKKPRSIPPPVPRT